LRDHVAEKMLAQSEVLWLAAGFDLPPRVGQWHRDILRMVPGDALSKITRWAT